ncbi:hypothetical protein KFE25_012355 [Diacronema lutheri]|uniref:PDZ domain-containing protein n=1 Tax=Diacronema lutheri TaxID=2081491 RepID=A0A8J6C807_DIALT|nr:hypothetical protein KFE25_012355 [Diacronema lutheri]
MFRASGRRVLARSAIALGASAAATAACSAPAAGKGAPLAAPPAPDDAELSADELRTIGIFERSCESVVFITNLRVASGPSWFAAPPVLDSPSVPTGSGSGIVWDARGHIVTNYHVVAGATELTVTMPSQDVYPATVVGTDVDRDIAVLRVRPKQPLRPLPLGSSARLRVGQTTLAIGCPFGLDFTLTTGVISGLGRDIMGRTGRPIVGCIQTDAALNPGSSGGPLLDSSGRVIGVNVAILTMSGSSAGVGISMPIDAVRQSVDQIISRGHVLRPSLGVRMAPDDYVQRRLGVAGVLVFEVQPRSGADVAGMRGTSRTRSGELKLGDLIVRAGGKDVKTSLDLFKAMEAVQVGDSVELEVVELDDSDGLGLREKGRRKLSVKAGGLAAKL